MTRGQAIVGAVKTAAICGLLSFMAVQAVAWTGLIERPAHWSHEDVWSFGVIAGALLGMWIGPAEDR